MNYFYCNRVHFFPKVIMEKTVIKKLTNLH
jgi:hypothetical protein